MQVGTDIQSGELAEVESAPERSEWRGRRFCLYFLLLSGLGFVLPLLWARTDLFIDYNDNIDSALIQFPFTLKNENYDFLLYGDSSGLFGLDPLIIQKEVGRPVLSLCTYRNVIIMTGTVGLDEYLKNNHRPKVLVLAISATDDDPNNLPGNPFTYEASLSTVRNGSLSSLWRMYSHPAGLINLYSRIVDTIVHPSFHRSDIWLQTFRNAHGHIPFPARLRPETCQGPYGARAPMTHGFTRQFISKYSAMGIRVVVYIAPTPDCNPYFDYYRTAMQGIRDNEPYKLPHQVMQNDFGDHPFPSMVPAISRRFGQDLRKIVPQFCGRPISQD